MPKKKSELNQTPNQMLWEACRNADIATATKAIAKGASPDATSSSDKLFEFRTPAIVEAAASGSPTIIRLLIAAGADIEACDEDGRTAIIYAGWKNKPDSVRELAEAGAAPNAKNKHGVSALSYAAAHGGLDALKALLAAGADIESTDLESNTAAMFAIRGSHFDILEALAAAGARMDRLLPDDRKAAGLEPIPTMPEMCRRFLVQWREIGRCKEALEEATQEPKPTPSKSKSKSKPIL